MDIILAAAVTIAPLVMYCGTRDEISTQLETQHKEQIEASAITKMGELLEIFVRKGGTKFSIVLTKPNPPNSSQETCVIMHGDGWKIESNDPQA